MQQRSKEIDGRRFTCAAHAQEVTHATHARIAAIADIARKAEGHAASADKYVKSWELVADKLSASGWSWGWVSAVDSEGRTLWIVDAHRDNGKRYVVRSDELLSAFLELERITHELALSALLRDDNHLK
jgi:hypothetical protein